MKRVHLRSTVATESAFLLRMILLLSLIGPADVFGMDTVWTPTRQFGFRPGTKTTLSLDGTSLLTLSNHCHLLDVETGLIQKTFYPKFRFHSFVNFSAVALSPDGKLIVTGYENGTACLWNVATADSIREFSCSNDKITIALFHPDGKTILLATDKNVFFFNVATGELIRTLSKYSLNIRSVAFSPDGVYLATGGERVSIGQKSSIIVWNTATGDTVHHISLSTSKSVNAVTFSPDGAFLLTENVNNTLYRWDMKSGDSLMTYSMRYPGDLQALAFSPDGKEFAAGYSDGLGRWNTATGELLEPFRPVYDAYSVDYTPDGSRLITTTSDHHIRIWDVSEGRCVDSIKGFQVENIGSVAYSPDGKTICAAPRYGYATLWNVDDGSLVGQFNDIAPDRVAFSPDGSHLCGVAGRTVGIWSTTTLDTVRSFSVYPAAFESVAWSPDGHYILAGIRYADNITLPRYAQLRDAATVDSVRSFGDHPDDVLAVAFSPDGTLVLTGCADNKARLWNAVTGESIRLFGEFTADITSVAFSPDGSYILIGSDTNKAPFCLWDVATGACIRTFSGYPLGGHSIVFSPDGQMILSGSYEVARLWNTATGECLRAFKRNSSWVNVAFSPDGKSVLTGSRTNTELYLWDISDVSLPARSAPPANRYLVPSLRMAGGNTLVISASGIRPFPGTARIFQLDGRLVASIRIDEVEEEPVMVRLDSPLAAGAYFYQLIGRRSTEVVGKGKFSHFGYRERDVCNSP